MGEPQDLCHLGSVDQVIDIHLAPHSRTVAEPTVTFFHVDG